MISLPIVLLFWWMIDFINSSLFGFAFFTFLFFGAHFEIFIIGFKVRCNMYILPIILSFIFSSPIFFSLHLIREEADKADLPTNVVFLGEMNKDYGKEKIIRLFEKSKLLREYEDLFELYLDKIKISDIFHTIKDQRALNIVLKNFNYRHDEEVVKKSLIIFLNRILTLSMVKILTCL